MSIKSFNKWSKPVVRLLIVLMLSKISLILTLSNIPAINFQLRQALPSIINFSYDLKLGPEELFNMSKNMRNVEDVFGWLHQYVRVKKKVNKYAFSEGKDSIENHIKYGANLQVGDEVFLKRILNSSENVARGREKSLDELRPYGLFVTIADAIGASIAWPCPFISVVREE